MWGSWRNPSLWINWRGRYARRSTNKHPANKHRSFAPTLRRRNPTPRKGPRLYFFFASDSIVRASPGRNKEIPMLQYAVVFLVIAVIAAIFGFGGIAAGAAGIAKILFVVFLIGAIVMFLMKGRTRT